VIAVDKQLATWVGGSILGGLELFSQMVVTREEHDESGRTNEK
jgi:actin-related protein